MSDTSRFYAIGVVRQSDTPQLDEVDWIGATDHPLDNSEAAHDRGLACSAPDTTFEAAIANAMQAQEVVMGTMDFVVVERDDTQVISFYAIERAIPDGLVGIMTQVVQLSESGGIVGKMAARVVVDRIIGLIDAELTKRNEHRASRA